MKNLFWAILVLVLAVYFPAKVLSQTDETGLAEKRFYIFFSQGSSEIPTSQKKTIGEVKQYLAENPELTPYFYGYRSQLQWQGEKSGSGWSRSRDGGLLVESVESVAKAIGVTEVDRVGLTTQPNVAWFKQMGKANDTPFVMVVIREDPNDRQDRQIAQLAGDVNHAQQTANSAESLAHNNASDIQTLGLRLGILENGQKTNPPLLRVGVGSIVVKYHDIEPKVVPSFRIEANLSNRFGLQAEGGAIPVPDFYQGEQTWDGICNAGAFFRPVSFIKILVGYSLAANFFERDFAIAESRDDAFMTGIELSAKIGPASVHVGGGYLQSDLNGGFISAGISF